MPPGVEDHCRKQLSYMLYRITKTSRLPALGLERKEQFISSEQAIPSLRIQTYQELVYSEFSDADDVKSRRSLKGLFKAPNNGYYSRHGG